MLLRKHEYNIMRKSYNTIQSLDLQVTGLSGMLLQMSVCRRF